MNVKSNPTASQQNKKKLPFSIFFPFLAGVVDTATLLSNISANFCKMGYSGARGKLIPEKA
jgi:hypothetical protein